MARAVQHDWATIRNAYVSGNMPLQNLSREHGGAANAPTYSALRKVAAAENWTQKRQEFQQQLQATKIDINEMRDRHLQISRAMMAIAVKGLRCKKPEDLSSRDIAMFMKLGIDCERLCIGEATARVETRSVDWEKLTDKQLTAIASGTPVIDVLSTQLN